MYLGRLKFDQESRVGDDFGVDNYAQSGEVLAEDRAMEEWIN